MRNTNWAFADIELSLLVKTLTLSAIETYGGPEQLTEIRNTITLVDWAGLPQRGRSDGTPRIRVVSIVRAAEMEGLRMTKKDFAQDLTPTEKSIPTNLVSAAARSPPKEVQTLHRQVRCAASPRTLA